MNKQELERMFNEQWEELMNSCEDCGIRKENTAIKTFIFETVIPDVLRTVCRYEWKEKSFAEWIKYETIEKNAKELYNINLNKKP